ncbi:hypothetical protein GRX03_05345 [Halovenus sp. WSH3]|uniref:DUF7344 domain-containing protein n=1 Tax=Halovenus carboxidivorans TaxID=2692199 RepID=A0A6B0T763_9EURY|nr:hypothetical protein [Halovenus carboxidivorans]MXR51031.1 hypothetical protein [Halovenus carboxidivorans]
MGFDQVADALGHRTRRHLLVKLAERPSIAVSSADEKIELMHTHLPKLDSMGYVVWDRERDTVVTGPNWGEIEPVIRLLRANKDSLPNDTFLEITQ